MIENLAQKIYTFSEELVVSHQRVSGFSARTSFCMGPLLEGFLRSWGVLKQIS